MDEALLYLEPQNDREGDIPFCAAFRAETSEDFRWAVFDINAFLAASCGGLVLAGCDPKDVAAAAIIVGVESLITTVVGMRG